MKYNLKVSRIVYIVLVALAFSFFFDLARSTNIASEPDVLGITTSPHNIYSYYTDTSHVTYSHVSGLPYLVVHPFYDTATVFPSKYTSAGFTLMGSSVTSTLTTHYSNSAGYLWNFYPKPYLAECENGDVYMLFNGGVISYSPVQNYIEVAHWNGTVWSLTSKATLFPYGGSASDYADGGSWGGGGSHIGCVDNTPIVVYNAQHHYLGNGSELRESTYMNVARYSGGNWSTSVVEYADNVSDIYNGSWITPTSFVFDRVTNSYILSYSKVNVTNPGLFTRYISAASNGTAVQMNVPTFPVGSNEAPYPLGELGAMFQGFQARDPANGDWLGTMFSWLKTSCGTSCTSYTYAGPFITRWDGSNFSIDSAIGTSTYERPTICVNEANAPTNDLYVTASGEIYKRSAGNTWTDIGTYATNSSTSNYRGSCRYTGTYDNVTGDFFIQYQSTSNYLKIVTTGPQLVVPTPTPTPSPLIGALSLTANPTIIAPGDSTTLEWTSLNLTGLNIDTGIGTVSVEGLRSVSPTSTTTYSIYGRNAQSGVIMGKSVTVQVTTIPEPTPTPTTGTPTPTLTATPTVTVTPPVISIPTVTTNQVTLNVTSNSATTGGDVVSDGGSPIVERGVVYSATQDLPSVSNADVVATSGSTGAMSVGLADLNSSTTYYVRAYAINSIGIAYGGVIAFATTAVEQTTVPTVVTGSASSISSHQFTVGGNVTSDGGSVVLERGFVYSATQQLPVLANSSKKLASGTTGQYVSTILNLSVNTTYYVRAYASNSIGTSYGLVITVKTSNTPTTSLPTVTTNQTVTNITANSASTGGYVTSAGSSGIIERGMVYSSTEQMPSLNNATVTRANGTLGAMSLSISSLSSGTTYYVRAFARNSTGTAYGSVVQFRTITQTKLVIPTVVTDSAINIALTVFTATGNVTSDGGSVILERGFVYSETESSPTISNAKKATVPGIMGQYSGSISDLTANRKYYVRAYARNAIGTGYGKTISVLTAPPVEAPPNLNVSDCPVIEEFRIEPKIVNPGEKAVLQWQVSNAQSVGITQFSAPLKNEGSISVLATATKKYNLFASNRGCVESKTVILTVNRAEIAINTLTAVTVTSLSEVAIFAVNLQGNILTAMISMIKKKRRGVGGIVYDTETKKPLPRITLRLIDMSTDKVVDIAVTDATGLFIFAPKKGKYKIAITQRGYKFPSDIVTTKVDGEYEPVYRSEELSIETDRDLIQVAIPLDPSDISGNEVLRQKTWKSIQQLVLYLSAVILVIGFTYSIYAVFVSPNSYNLLVLCFYIVMFIFKIVALLSLNSMQGKVTLLNGRPVEGLEVALYEPEFHTLLRRTFTRKDGSYTFLVENKDYYLEVLDDRYKIVRRNQGSLGVHSRKVVSKTPFRLVSERIVISAVT
jgi:hypothetical protein